MCIPVSLIDFVLVSYSAMCKDFIIRCTIMYCVISAESTKSKKKTKVSGMDNIMRTARLQQEPPTSTGTSLVRVWEVSIQYT